MRNIILVLAVLVSCGLFGGCSKKDDSCNPVFDAAPASEVTALEQYLTSNNIQATKSEYGFYYTIDAAGGEFKPEVCSEIVVNYKGTLTSGAIFDNPPDDKTFKLSNLIKGWQLGIPMIGNGGKITLYLPPSLGYGSTANNGIPANSILIFTINLVKVL